MNCKPNTDKVGGIMVLFEPDLSVTIPAIEALATQVSELCIIDNTPNSTIGPQLQVFENVHYIPLGENRGIAAAQNVGIKYFIEKGSIDFVVFSDQDSYAPVGTVAALLDGFNVISQKENIIVIGPQPINKKNNRSYVINYTKLNEIIFDDNKYWEMLLIISSLSLTKIDYFKKFGLFNESLFIDGVEHEWNWRIKSLTNGKIIMLPDLKIEHELGKYSKTLGKQVNISSSFRLYYQIRNYLWLSKLNYTPRSWVKYHKFKNITKSIAYPILYRSHVKYLKSVYKGWKDGIIKGLHDV